MKIFKILLEFGVSWFFFRTNPLEKEKMHILKFLDIKLGASRNFKKQLNH